MLVIKRPAAGRRFGRTVKLMSEAKTPVSRIILGGALSLLVLLLVGTLIWRSTEQTSTVGTNGQARPTPGSLIDATGFPDGGAGARAGPANPEEPRNNQIILSSPLAPARTDPVLVGMYGDTPCWNSEPSSLTCTGELSSWKGSMSAEILQIVSQRNNSPLCVVLATGEVWCFRPDAKTGVTEGGGQLVDMLFPVTAASAFGSKVCGLTRVSDATKVVCDVGTTTATYETSNFMDIIRQLYPLGENVPDLFLSGGTVPSSGDVPAVGTDGATALCLQTAKPACSVLGIPGLTELYGIPDTGKQVANLAVTPEGIACIILGEEVLCTQPGRLLNGQEKVEFGSLMVSLTAGTSGEAGRSYAICGLNQTLSQIQCVKLQSYPFETGPVISAPVTIEAVGVGATRGIVVTDDYRLGFFDLPD